MNKPRLLVHTSPFLGSSVDTPRLMREVIYALVPTVLAATWFFGISAILVMGAATAGAMLTEWFFYRRTLGDASALLTGLLLGLTLPPGLPLWMAFLGGVTAIGLGKAVWGGLGQNLFNPALVGRAFLQAAFPTAITTWSANEGPGDFWSLDGGTLALPLMQPTVDVMSTATPLGLMKFEQTSTDLGSLFLGSTGGSLGETSAILIILASLYLGLRGIIDWRIPGSILLSVAVFSGVFYLLDPGRYPSPLFMMGSGGLLFGAVFMATDPVCSPMAPRGTWFYGVGIGALVVLIRLFGGLPEGVMYAILLMNAATPLIERSTQPRPFGRSPE